MDQDMVSFVLRFVREVSEDQQARWRGVIKHVQSNAEANFSNFAEALVFIQSHVNQLIAATFEETDRMARESSGYNPFVESARLWSDFMKPYASMVSETMDEAMSAASPVSQQMKKAMSSSMAAWGFPFESYQTNELKSLSDQVAALALKVGELQAQLLSDQKSAGQEEE